MNFEDHFSKGSKDYARYRPHYPPELFAYLQTLTPGHELAWDCATGSGQAAHDLARYYDHVHASDASSNQIRQAVQHERITFCVEQAERTSLANSRVDLVTVAIAIHWFNFEGFYDEVLRVVKPEGILAAWTYHLPVINPDLDSFLACFDDEILKEYWPERYQYLYNHYRTLPFHFKEVIPPEFTIEAEWTLSQMLGFIDSWSAVRRYKEQHGFHPLKPVWENFLAAWGKEDQPQIIRWPLYLRVGRVHALKEDRH